MPTIAAGQDSPFPPPIRGVGNIDAFDLASSPISESEQILIDRIESRIRRDDVELPQLPQTQIAVLDMVSNPGIEIAEIVELIARDPVLSSELLRYANSVAQSSIAPVETIRDAVVRIGMRSLKRMAYALSLRSVIFRDRHLMMYAQEIWRQAFSTGSIGRTIAPHLGFDAERIFLVCLLADIGKVGLISMMRRELKNDRRMRLEIGKKLTCALFDRLHETAGRRIAESWGLSPEIVSVAGCHHDYDDNEVFRESAALASLAHRCDLFLSTGNEGAFESLMEASEFSLFAADLQTRRKVLKAAFEAYQQDGLGEI